jgi:hypothetical protein
MEQMVEIQVVAPAPGSRRQYARIIRVPHARAISGNRRPAPVIRYPPEFSYLIRLIIRNCTHIRIIRSRREILFWENLKFSGGNLYRSNDVFDWYELALPVGMRSFWHHRRTKYQPVIFIVITGQSQPDLDSVHNLQALK